MLSFIARAVFLAATVLMLSHATRAQQSASQANHKTDGALFQTGDRCIACHSNLTAPSGEDVSIGYAWRASMMANSSRDPYWQAAVRREVMDHPQAQAEIEDNCATCHMPMSRTTDAGSGRRARVFAHFPNGEHDSASARLTSLAQDGVSCTTCHQIRPDNFGTSDSFTGGFVIDTKRNSSRRELFGPLQVDSGRQSVMESATHFVPTEATHVQQSELCATCHTLYTHALSPSGEQVGRLPEQVPYLEWRHSEYKGTHSCQSCHMPQLSGDAPVSSVLGQPRAGFSQHTFEGGNAFMLKILNKHREDLGVTALPQELEAAARRTIEFLGTQTARVAIESAKITGSELNIGVSIQNLSGHKLPTAYPSRRVWVNLIVRDARGDIAFESGKLEPDGSIAGNDNDADPARYEAHHDRIDDASDVQIYESVMTDPNGKITTGLLQADRYVKDNRLLPRGFDKANTSADIAVHGEAKQDRDFGGGSDRIRYVIAVGAAQAPLTVTARLWFQSIGYRWAQNLKPYDAAETRRFVSYYEGAATDSAVQLASDTTILEMR